MNSYGFINFGIPNFTHILFSIYSIFQVVTMDGWSTIMYNMMDSQFPFLAALIFIFLIIIGSFFLINLILAVIIKAFINI